MARDFQNIEKRDIVEVVSEYIELSPPLGSAARPYHTALCPFHDDESPSFVVFVAVQRWKCMSCDPKGGDVIDFVMRMNRVGFEEAKRLCCEPVSPAVVALKGFEKAAGARPLDLSSISVRLRKVFDRLDYADALSVHSDVDALIAEGKLVEADRYLKHRGL